MTTKKVFLTVFSVVLVSVASLSAEPFFDFGVTFGKRHNHGISFGFGATRPVTKTYVVQPMPSIIYCDACNCACDDGFCPNCFEQVTYVRRESRQARKRRNAYNELADIKTRKRRLECKITDLQDEIERLEDELDRMNVKIAKLESQTAE